MSHQRWRFVVAALIVGGLVAAGGARPNSTPSQWSDSGPPGVSKQIAEVRGGYTPGGSPGIATPTE